MSLRERGLRDRGLVSDFDFDKTPETVGEMMTMEAARKVHSFLSLAREQGLEATPREIVERAMQMVDEG